MNEELSLPDPALLQSDESDILPDQGTGALEAEPVRIEDLASIPVMDRQSQAKLDKLTRDAAALEGRRLALIARENELTENVGVAKGRLALKGELQAAMDELQKMAHERSVGSFERMLTAITQDVQKNTPVEIRLDLTSERNMPALNVSASVNGKPEAVTSGALNNIVSTGLRFITLARSGRARFMLLDEPDCYIESGDVQNFFNVVDQLSRDAGIQTVLITHHDVSAFEDRFRIYKIAEIDSEDQWPRRIPELVSEGVMEPSPIQDRHFTFVEATNFESYTHAQIELSPGVTVITGKNNKCKSGWARMLRSALLGQSSDDSVRHDTPGLTVSVGISDGRVLSHSRRVKGASKGEFVMHTIDSYDYAQSHPTTWKKDEMAPRPLHHSETLRLPEWVSKETGVSDIDGINVAMWPQLTPVFMLDQAPSKRASLLSIGRESGHLFAMNELYKEDVQSDNVTVRTGEKEIGAIRSLKALMEPLEQIVPALDEAKLYLEAIIEEQDSIRKGEELLQSILDQKAELAALAEWNEIARQMPEPPEVQRTEGLTIYLDRVQVAMEAIALRTDAVIPDVPQLAGADQVETLLQGMSAAAADASMAGKIPLQVETPAIAETSSLSRSLADLTQAQEDCARPILTKVDAPEIFDTQLCLDAISGIAAAQLESRVAKLDVVVEPLVQNTQDISVILEGMTLAERERKVPTFASVAQPEFLETEKLEQLLEEMLRQQALINGCRAAGERLEAEGRLIDTAIERATDVLGAQWDLSSERVSKLVDQVVQSTHGTGADRKVVCQLGALEQQINAVAKEGYAHGLTEGLARASVVRNKHDTEAASTHAAPK